MGEHARRDARRRQGARRDAARACPASRSTTTSSGRPTFIEISISNLTDALLLGTLLVVRRPGRVPLRVAGGGHQPGRDPALADGGGARALPARRDDQHDGAGGVRDLGRGGRRRRHHRHREHRPAAAPEPGRRPSDGRSCRSCSRPRSRCGGRSSTRRSSSCSPSCRCSSSRASRARSSSRSCSPTGWPCWPRWWSRSRSRPRWRCCCSARAPLEEQQPPLVRLLQRGYTAALRRVDPHPVRSPWSRRPRRSSPGVAVPAVPRRVALPDVQGARLPRPLGDAAEHGPPGDRAHHRAGQPRPPRHPRRARVRRAHRPGGAGRGDQRHQLRRGLAQPRVPRPTTTRRSTRSARPSTPTPGSSASRRPT